MSFNYGEKQTKSRGWTAVNIANPSNQEWDMYYQMFPFAQRQQEALETGMDRIGQTEESAAGRAWRAADEAAATTMQARARGEIPVISDAERAQIDAMYAPIAARGNEDILRMAHDLAASRGLSPSDSPIGDATLQEARKFQEALSGQKAQAYMTRGQYSDQFNQGLANFQNQLRQQAMQNRLSFGAAGSPTAGLQNQMFGQRLSQAGQSYAGSSYGTQWNAGIDLNKILGAALGAAAGGGCWIAAAIYGDGTPAFYRARNFIMHKWTGLVADATRYVYRVVGPWLAPRVRRHAWLRRALKPLFDAAVRRG